MSEPTKPMRVEGYDRDGNFVVEELRDGEWTTKIVTPTRIDVPVGALVSTARFPAPSESTTRITTAELHRIRDAAIDVLDRREAWARAHQAGDDTTLAAQAVQDSLERLRRAVYGNDEAARFAASLLLGGRG